MNPTREPGPLVPFGVAIELAAIDPADSIFS